MTAAQADFAERLRSTIDERGVTMVWLRDRLAERGTPVSLATLSYWRSGRRRPAGDGSLTAVAVIEDLLGLPPDDLTGRLGPPGRTRTSGRASIPLTDEELRLAAAETMDALGAASLQQVRVVTVHVVVDVGAGGRVERVTTRMLGQVTSGTVTETPYVLVAAEPTDLRPKVSVGPGRRIVRSHQHPGGRVNGWVIALAEPLEAPATSMVELTVDYPDGYPVKDEHAYLLTRQAREALMWVRFHPDRRPVWCEAFSATETSPLALGAGTSVHVLRTRFGPDVLGVRWGFDAG